MDKPKIFDGWEEVACDDCEHYWNSTCDSHSESHRRLCSSFKMTRQASIPKQIKTLEKRLSVALRGIVVLGVLQLVVLIMLVGVIL